MIRENKGFLVITSLIILLPALIGLLLWAQLPEQLPIHFNSNGVADSFESKQRAILLYFVILVIHWVAALFTSMDPRKANVSRKIYRLVLCICPLVSVFMGVVIYGSALHWSWVNVNMMANVLVGIIFVVIGNYLPKCRQNYTIGIKLPWTLMNEENWDKTHRFAGKIWMLGGLIAMITGFIPVLKLEVVTIILIIAMTVPVVIYSYLLYRKKMG